jgi:translocation and assembly module TamA
MLFLGMAVTVSAARYHRSLWIKMIRRLLLFLLCCLPSWAQAACQGEAENCAPLLNIKIEGVSGAIYDNVLKGLSLARQKNHPRLNTRWMKILHARAEAEISQALEPFGYYRADILAKLETRPCHHKDAPADCRDQYWDAHYHITLGEPVRVAQVHIEIQGVAANDKSFQDLRAAFPLKVGDVLRHADYEKAKKDFLRLAQARGYFEAAFSTHAIRIDKNTFDAEIVLHLNSGTRYRFGELRFEQQPEVFAHEFMRRFVEFEQGTEYTADKLMELHNSLVDSSYFAEAIVEPEPEPEQAQDGEVPIRIYVKPRKANQYSAGIGYGTDTGVRGSLSWERRYLNRFGHRFRTDLQASGGTDLANASLRWSAGYFIPIAHPNRQYLSFNAGYADEHNKQWQSQTALVSAAYHRPRLFKQWRLQETLSLEYRHERYRLGEQATTSANLLMPIAEWTYVRAPERMYPREGEKITLGVRGALENVGSDVSFLQVRSSAKIIRSAGERHRFIARGEAGLSMVGELNELPASQRFFAGGDHSVRGYRYQSLGSRAADGTVIGGEYLLSGGLEYEYRFLPKWSGAVFYDAGNAFADFNEDLKHGVGAGVRWLSPIGPVRVDVAIPLASEVDGFRIHIIIGPDL